MKPYGNASQPDLRDKPADAVHQINIKQLVLDYQKHLFEQRNSGARALHVNRKKRNEGCREERKHKGKNK